MYELLTAEFRTENDISSLTQVLLEQGGVSIIFGDRFQGNGQLAINDNIIVYLLRNSNLALEKLEAHLVLLEKYIDISAILSASDNVIYHCRIACRLDLLIVECNVCSLSKLL